MAKSFTIRTAAAAEIVARLRGSFNGRSIRVSADGAAVEIYGSKGDAAALGAMLASEARNGEQPATARQIAYLRSLVQDDPAAAAALHVPTDLATLSKPRASRLIDQMTKF